MLKYSSFKIDCIGKCSLVSQLMAPIAFLFTQGFSYIWFFATFWVAKKYCNNQHLLLHINVPAEANGVFKVIHIHNAMALILVFCALLLISIILQPGKCQTFRQDAFRKIKKRHLENHVINTKQAGSEFECIMHCLADGSCASVNFKTSGINKGLCELNNSTLLEKSGVDKDLISGYNHLYIVEKVRENANFFSDIS